MKKLLFLVTLLCAAFTASAETTYSVVGPVFIDGTNSKEMTFENGIATLTANFQRQTFNIVKIEDGVETKYGPVSNGDIINPGDYYVTITNEKSWVFSAVIIPDPMTYRELTLTFNPETLVLNIVPEDTTTGGGDGDDDKEKPEAPETVPAPAHDASKVFSFFSPYREVKFENGGWEASTTTYESVSIDGKTILKLSNFNYLGLVGFNIDVADYDYMHVDYWTPTENTNFGFVPISLNPTQDGPIYWAQSVKAGEWNSYDAELKNFNSDKTKIEQIKFDAQGGPAPASAYIANIYFWKDDSEKPDPDQPVDPKPEDPQITFDGTVFVGRGEKVDIIEDPQTHEQISEHPFVLNYHLSYNDDQTLTIYGTFEWPEGNPSTGLTGNIIAYFPDGNIEVKLDKNGANVSTQKFEKGKEIQITFWDARAFGRCQYDVLYTVGDEFEIQLPAEYAEKQESSNIDHVARELRLVTTEKEAVLYVAAPEGTTVSYINEPTPTPDEVKARRVDADWQTATDNLIKLSDAQGTLSVKYIKYIKDDKDDLIPVDDMTPVVYSYSVARNTETGVDTFEPADKGEAVYFTLDGRKVTNPDKGIFIKVMEGKTEKIIK